MKSSGEKRDFLKRTEEDSIGKLLIIHATTQDATGIIVEAKDQIYVGDLFTGDGLVIENLDQSIEHEALNPMEELKGGKELLLEVEQTPEDDVGDEFDISDVSDFSDEEGEGDSYFDEGGDLDEGGLDKGDTGDDDQRYELEQLETLDSGEPTQNTLDDAFDSVPPEGYEVIDEGADIEMERAPMGRSISSVEQEGEGENETEGEGEEVTDTEPESIRYIDDDLIEEFDVTDAEQLQDLESL